MKKLFIIYIAALLFSCVSREERGFVINDFDHKYIKNLDVYNVSKNNLLSNLGSPTLMLNDNTWLYYYYTTKNYRFLKNKIDKEKILLIYFDNKNNIKNFSYNERNGVKNIKSIYDGENKIRDNFFRSLINGLIITPISD